MKKRLLAVALACSMVAGVFSTGTASYATEVTTEAVSEEGTGSTVITDETEETTEAATEVTTEVATDEVEKKTALDVEKEVKQELDGQAPEGDVEEDVVVPDSFTMQDATGITLSSFATGTLTSRCSNEIRDVFNVNTSTSVLPIYAIDENSILNFNFAGRGISKNNVAAIGFASFFIHEQESNGYGYGYWDTIYENTGCYGWLNNDSNSSMNADCLMAGDSKSLTDSVYSGSFRLKDVLDWDYLKEQGYAMAIVIYKDKTCNLIPMTLKGSVIEGVAKIGSTEVEPMYRLYNPNSGEHFYTASIGERDSVWNAGWRYEGMSWYAPKSGDPVYRLYNKNAGDHHYTTSASEKNYLVSVGWSYEGVAWRSGGSSPLYRAYNPNAVAGAHHYTTNKAEIDSIVAAGWKYEGKAWNGVGFN